nr:C4-type zinc ribbon domain-containing protein [Desulfonatronum thiosulfatophilum]
MYMKQIEQLVALQMIDDEMMHLNGFLKNAPAELERMEARHLELKDAVAQVNAKIAIITKQRDDLGREIEDTAMKIKKSKNKLMMVSNSKEHQAMMREIDNLEKTNRSREEEKVSLLEELARQEERLDMAQGELKSLQQEISQKKKQINQKLQASKARLEVLQNLRGDAEEVIPKPILSRYQFIRSRLSQPVVVSVGEGVCKGCNISIPPQTYNVLQKGEQILSCPNCQRIIYWSEHFATEEEEAEAV